MTVRVATVEYAPGGHRDLVAVEWAELTNDTPADVGSRVDLPGWADRSVQLTGTLGTGGEVTIQGSNVAEPGDATDSDDWGVLHDLDGNELTLDTIGQIKQVREITRWMRPAVTAGDGDTSLGVALIARRGS